MFYQLLTLKVCLEQIIFSRDSYLKHIDAVTIGKDEEQRSKGSDEKTLSPVSPMILDNQMTQVLY
jgi:hypothetical protein